MDNYIYALVDPKKCEIRYIGKSCRPKERLTNELNEHSNTHRCHWLQYLKALQLRPIQIIIEKVPLDMDWQLREKYWIAHFRSLGCNLVNDTDGGDGVTNLSPESKAKMLRTWTGRKHKPESLIKIGLASKGRLHDDKWKQNMKQWMAKRQFTPEYRKKLSLGVSKLNELQVIEIKKLISEKIPQRIIAGMFGVHQGTISHINRGLFYKSISQEESGVINE